MKRTLTFVLPILGVALLSARGFSGGTDLSKEVPRSLPPFSWAGPYIGINAGGTFGKSYASDLNAFDSPISPIRPEVFHYDTTGFTGGLQMGYNWQAGRIVYGVEADLGYLNVDGSGDHTGIIVGPPEIGAQQVGERVTETSSTESNFFATLRGRIGFTVKDKWLLYVTGGAIVVNYDASINTGVNSATDSELRPGWTLGGGIEYAFNNHWSLKGEYLYYGLEDGTVEFDNPNPPSGVSFTRFHYQTTSYGHIVRLGLNYRFGAPERPVPAYEKYDSKDSKEVLAPVTSQFNWTGPYFGVHFGFGFGGLNWKDEPPDTKETLVDHYQHGIFGGAQTGVNYEFGNGIVLGVEGKFSGTDISKESSHNLNDEPNNYDTSVEWMGSATVRAGFAWPHFLHGRLLTYVKGGVSDAHVRYHSTHIESANTDMFDSEEGRFAPIIGGGLEYAICDHWTLKVEYNYADYGTRIIHGPSLDDNIIETEAYETKLRLHTIEIGVNYKF